MQGQYRNEILDGYSLEDAEEFLGDDEKRLQKVSMGNRLGIPS